MTLMYITAWKTHDLILGFANRWHKIFQIYYKKKIKH